MKVGPTDILRAEARTLEARTRLFATLNRMQERLRPSHLAQDAVESAAYGVASVARKGAQAVRGRPFAAAAIAGTIGLVAARGWILDILRGSSGADETPGPAEGLKPKRKKHAKKETGK
jgi:ElaB/YqjD/DUF883 family membrane-anchored ribosome-binding protein